MTIIRSRMTRFALAAMLCAPVTVLPQAPAAPASSVKSGSLTFPADLPLRRDGDKQDEASAHMAVWGVLVLGLLAGSTWLALRRKTGASPLPWLGLGRAAGGPAPKLTGRISLGPRTSVCVVQWNEEEMLLGCTDQSVTVLSRRPLATAPGRGS